MFIHERGFKNVYKFKAAFTPKAIIEFCVWHVDDKYEGNMLITFQQHNALLPYIKYVLWEVVAPLLPCKR